MKKKKFYLCFLLGLWLAGTGIAQEETFVFKLYLESGNGKKDTLELGVGPDGYGNHDEGYDTAYSNPVFEPISDTAEHIGAFIVTGLEYGYPRHEQLTRVKNPVYMKKRIGRNGSDLTIIFPASAQPVKVSWDQTRLQDPIIETPILTTTIPSNRWDLLCGYLTPLWLKLFMPDESSCTIGYEGEGIYTDTLCKFTFIPDSTGNDHQYIHFFILPGWDRHALTEDLPEAEMFSQVQLRPNPVRNRFTWTSDQKLSEWRIYSLSGKLMESGISGQQEIDCSDWSSGMYVFVGNDYNGQQHLVKFIKQ